MTDNMLAIDPVTTAILAIAGVALGFAYFASLKYSVALLAEGKGWLRPVAYALGRFCAAGALLFVAVKLGAAPLLAAFAGFLVARVLVLRAHRRAG